MYSLCHKYSCVLRWWYWDNISYYFYMKEILWKVLISHYFSLWIYNESDERGLVSTQRRTMSGVADYHHPCATHTIGLRWAYTQSLPLGSTHGKTMIGVACYIALGYHMVGRCRDCHEKFPFGKHKLSNDVDMACHHPLWTAHMDGRRQVLHAIIALVHHTRSH